ncbi:MAG: hypothetical protein AB7O84_24745 [Planctomycetota bacterium]
MTGTPRLHLLLTAVALVAAIAFAVSWRGGGPAAAPAAAPSSDVAAAAGGPMPAVASPASGDRVPEPPRSSSPTPAAAAPAAPPAWQTALATCARDPRFGYPLDEVLQLHEMVSRHHHDVSVYDLEVRVLLLSERVNPQKTQLTAEQRAELEAGLAIFGSQIRELAEPLFAGLGDEFHAAVDGARYEVVPAGDRDATRRVMERLDQQFGRQGQDYLVLSSTLRLADQVHGALIRVTRESSPWVFDKLARIRELREQGKVEAARIVAQM